MPLLSDGQEINRTYQVERFLGEGAFAEVYRVRHRFLGRQAIKIFKSPGLTNDDLEKQLEEAVLLSQVGHPNIIRVFDANVVQSHQQQFGYFTMEYVAGGSLYQFWQSYRLKLMPVDTAVELIKQACRGLAVAHSANPPIVHRDIKPQNLLVGYEGDGLRLRVSDFGLAKHANPLTMLVSAKGTPVFKAPEVFRQSNADSCAGDVWALGCTFYLLLTDQRPFPIMRQVGSGNIPIFSKPLTPPSYYNINVDKFLEGIVMKALSISPDARYPSSREMLMDLENWRPSISRIREKIMVKTSKPRLGPVPTYIDKGNDKSRKGAQRNRKKAEQDQIEAEKMAKKAIMLSRHFDKLVEAADMMEQAFNKWPLLRDEYTYQVTLWRRGIIS